MDRGKVIKGLECHRIDNNHRINCADCPYYIDDDNHIRCVNDLHDDAIAMLKKQEAKTPVEYEHNGYWYNICPTCGNHEEELLRQWNYCPFCGEAVKLE